jgi:hypothetical protein
MPAKSHQFLDTPLQALPPTHWRTIFGSDLPPLKPTMSSGFSARDSVVTPKAPASWLWARSISQRRCPTSCSSVRRWSSRLATLARSACSSGVIATMRGQSVGCQLNNAKRTFANSAVLDFDNVNRRTRHAATANQVAALRLGLSAFPSDINRVRLLITFGGCRTLLGAAGERPVAGQPLSRANS